MHVLWRTPRTYVSTTSFCVSSGKKRCAGGGLCRQHNQRMETLCLVLAVQQVCMVWSVRPCMTRWQHVLPQLSGSTQGRAKAARSYIKECLAIFVTVWSQTAFAAHIVCYSLSTSDMQHLGR